MNTIAWLDRLPTKWPTKRLKYATTLQAKRVDASSDDRRYLGLENIESWTGRFIEANNGNKTNDGEFEAQGTATSFAVGDVLFGKLRPYLAKAMLAENDGICSTELLVLKPAKELNARFLFYLLLCPQFIVLVDSSTFGAKMPRANWDFIGAIQIPLPSLPIQRRIAGYLDAETAQIDALVAEKERMLALLEEKRAALVSRAVTRGLHSDIPMKPSGLDWLGDIPAHWDVRRLKNVAQELQTGPFGSQLHAEEYTDAGIPVINPADIAGFQINGNKAAKIDRDTAERLSRHRMVPGDVIFARRGELGRSAVVGPEQDGWLCGTGCLRVRLNQDFLDPEFLLFVMADTNAGNFLGAESVGSTMENLNTETLGRLLIPFPPLIEQRAIVQHLQNEQQHLENLKGVLAASISLLKERRSALITAAVTGQLAPEAMSA